MIRTPGPDQCPIEVLSLPSEQPSAPVGIPPGEVIGGYRIVRLIGAGSTSHVYLGQHARLGRPAAIKVLHADLVDNPKVVHRMLTEARVVNDIRHPNIVDIIDFVDQEKPRRVALVMEHIAGPSVDDLRGGEPLPWRQASGIARQLVDAVEAAHRAGVIHRDLKPENLLLTSDPRSTGHTIPQLKVVDFGIAKVAGPTPDHQTATQTMLGTPAYMAPEQIAQTPPPTGATDVFAVGEILYELLAGQRAYRAARLSDVVRQKLRGEIPDLPLPPMPGRVELQTLIRRCLAFKGEDRPNLSEVVALLGTVEALPGHRDGAADVSAQGWDTDESGADALLSEATQLSEVVGREGRASALWTGDPDAIDEETIGASSPTHLALPRTRDEPDPPGKPVLALEQTEPLSAKHMALVEPSIRDPERAPYDPQDQAGLHAETAMSAETLRDDEADATRDDAQDAPAVYEDMPTRDVLPALAHHDTPRASGFGSAVGPVETLVGPATGGDKPPLVPARDGGPPVPADDPLAKPRASTVIRPKSPPSDTKKVADPAGGAADGKKPVWADALHRAMHARAKPAERDDRSARRTPPEGSARLRGPADAAHRLGSAAIANAEFGEAKVMTRVERQGWPLIVLMVPFVLVLSLAILLTVRAMAPARRAPIVRPRPADRAVEVRSLPRDAFIEDAETGEFLGKTPTPVTLLRGHRRVRVFKAGFAAQVVELSEGVPLMKVTLAAE